MTKKKKKDIENYVKYKRDAKTKACVDLILERLGQHVTRDLILVELREKLEMRNSKAEDIIDVTMAVAFNTNADYVTSILGSVQYGHTQNIQMLDGLIKTSTARDKADLIKTRMRAFDSLQKLLPTQIDITTSDKSVKDVMFDLYSLEKPEVEEVDEDED